MTSDPSNCRVRVNGVDLGETPLEVKELFPGRYRVQTECEAGRPSRVHETEVRFERVDVFVDTRFDGVVQTRPVLHLRYDDAEAEQRDRVSDAEQLPSRSRRRRCSWCTRARPTSSNSRSFVENRPSCTPWYESGAGPEGPACW